jgi:hemerythrin
MSQPIAWDFRTNSHCVDEMNRQHDILIALINELAHRNQERPSKEELTELLDQLCSLTLQHFEAEEAYMRATGYARADIHCLIHRKLIAKLFEHVAMFNAGEGKLDHKLSSFLDFWLAAHINGADQYYTRHVAEQSARGQALG